MSSGGGAGAPRRIVSGGVLLGRAAGSDTPSLGPAPLAALFVYLAPRRRHVPGRAGGGGPPAGLGHLRLPVCGGTGACGAGERPPRRHRHRGAPAAGGRAAAPPGTERIGRWLAADLEAANLNATGGPGVRLESAAGSVAGLLFGIAGSRGRYRAPFRN